MKAAERNDAAAGFPSNHRLNNADLFKRILTNK